MLQTRRLARSVGVPLLTAVIALASSSTIVGAQAPTEAPTPAQLLEDFNFYVNTANTTMAEANARALLDRGLTPGEFLGLVEDSPRMSDRFDQAYRRALLVPELEGLAADLYRLYIQGRRDRARQPEEIERNIEMLTGTMSNKLFARDRLREAREHAVPALLQVLMESRDPALRAEAQVLLRDMGRDAVSPLSAALLSVGPETQELIAQVLGGIPYRMSLPYLYELRSTTNSAAARSAAERAISRIEGSVEPGSPVSGLYRELADTYFTGSRSLLTFPDEEHQLLWSFEPSIGLHPTAIRTEVFHEARAMELAEKALNLDSNDGAALSLWLAANFQRELDTPEGYENPAYGAERREAMYYAVAAGSAPTQRVLARALKDRNTRLARQAIEALSRSAGGTDLWAGLGEERPLLDALNYPDRRVQFEAALAIARARPTTSFTGAERVVPVLAGAIRDGAKRYAVVLATDPQHQQTIRAVLEAQGYTVLAPAQRMDQVAADIAQTPGIDVIVTRLPADSAIEMAESLRDSPRLSATPVLALMPLADVQRLSSRLVPGGIIELRSEGVTADQLGASIEQLVTRASGAPVGADEARAYSLEAISVLDGLTSGNSVLDVGDAAAPLLTALREQSGELKLRIARLLAHVCRPVVQSALIEEALGASGEERVALLGAAAESAKRCGNRSELRLVERLIELANEGSDEEATAAAALMGALNLPNTQVVPLITGGVGG